MRNVKDQTSRGALSCEVALLGGALSSGRSMGNNSLEVRTDSLHEIWSQSYIDIHFMVVWVFGVFLRPNGWIVFLPKMYCLGYEFH